MTINRRPADARRFWKGLAFSLACLAAFLPGRVFAQGAQLKLDALDGLASRAKETVNVSLDPSMMQMASSFLAGAKNAGAQGKNIADLVAGLKGIYVRNYSFDKEGAYTPADVASVRSQLKAPWKAMVTTREHNESVDVYTWPEGGQMGGLAVLVAEPKELTVVNIVGRIDMALLSSLAGSFGIPSTLGTPSAASAAQSSKPCMIAGLVRNSSGAPLAGVNIELVSDVQGDQGRTITTDADGKFQFTGLPSGTYTLTASFPEFQTFKREGMYLSPGMNTTMTVNLRPNPIRD